MRYRLTGTATIATIATIAGRDASSCRTDKTDGRVSERVPMSRVVQNRMKGTAQKNVMGTVP